MGNAASVGEVKRMWQYVASGELGVCPKEELKKTDLALGDSEGSPGDPRPIRQDNGEIGGSFGSFGHCREPQRNQYMVGDRRRIA